jgi:hypothetical protein
LVRVLVIAIGFLAIATRVLPRKKNLMLGSNELDYPRISDSLSPNGHIVHILPRLRGVEAPKGEILIQLRIYAKVLSNLIVREPIGRILFIDADLTKHSLVICFRHVFIASLFVADSAYE